MWELISLSNSFCISELLQERQERLKSLKAQFSSIPMMMNASTCNGSLPEGASSEVLGDPSTGFIVNVVREEGEDAVRIPPSISAKLKTHQVYIYIFVLQNFLCVCIIMLIRSSHVL